MKMCDIGSSIGFLLMVFKEEMRGIGLSRFIDVYFIMVGYV